MTPEHLRRYRQILLAHLEAWKTPPVQLPPDSVIDAALREIVREVELEAAKQPLERATGQHSIDT